MAEAAENLLQLFIDDIPLMDVRAPVEFARGAFPNTVNLPLLDDKEREAVGIRYKTEGQAAAIALGQELVSGEIKAARLKSWLEFAKNHPQGRLYCFRGGLRSKTVQQWMAEAGAPYPLIAGGYKALRRSLIDALDNFSNQRSCFVISGRTGNGKTEVIQALPNAADLEALANHRGSSFGRRLAPQPSQIDFENALTVRLLKLDAKKPAFLEDEGRLIGRCAMPENLLAALNRWPVVILEETPERRIANVQRDYVTGLLAEYQAVYGDKGFDEFATFLKGSLHRIRKRLGGLLYDKLAALMNAALDAQRLTGDEALHKLWIEELLITYYDPMYDYQFGQKESRIAFRGGREAVLEWCRNIQSV
jgi:tRNA 2-selenouridine synthase